MKHRFNSQRGNILYGMGALIVVVMLIGLLFFRFAVIDGHQRGVKISIDGVSKEPLQPGWTGYVPLVTRLRLANVGQQKYVMNDLPMATEKHAGGREKGELILKSKDNQNVHVAAILLWHRDPAKVVYQQTTICNVDDDNAFDELVLYQPLFLTIKNNITVMDAIASYSGEATVFLQQNIEKQLRYNPEFEKAGVVVDSFSLDVSFDQAFIDPIVKRQIAVQEQTMYTEQQKAASAKALVAQADAMAEKNKRVVVAEGDKAVAVLKAEQEQQMVVLKAEGDQKQVVLQAEGQKKQQVLQAEGEKEAAQNKSDAILAVGQANAAAQKLLYTSYSAPGAEVFAKIEIAKHMAESYRGVTGFIPEGMNISTFADTFQKGVGLMVNPQPPK